MKNLNIPVGISDFERIRELNYYYVDKTGLIKTLLQGEMDQVTLITRPRRFGKTMAMNMLNSFLDIRKDSRHLFKGLEISDEVEICEKWMNQYPTLFLSFKDVDGTTFENAFNFLKFIISEVCKQHVYLLDSDEIDEGDKLVFQKLKTCSASMMEIQSCILRITNMLKSYYKKPVILLIDEYDVPIAKASSNGYYKEMLEIMKGLLSTALKDNSSLKFAVITGCLKIAKESIFTGTNNFVSDTISSTRYNEYYGFTQQDVDKLLADAEIEEKADLIKEWYDGYNFGEFEDSARVTNRKDLFDAVWNKDADKATKEISTLLRMTISYYDYRENFYHAFLVGIFAGVGYSVESNREHGEGRSDIVIYNDVTGQVAVFEAKYSRKLEDLEKDCQKALDQINTKMYAKEFEDAYEEVLCYGIAFYKKRCLVKSK